MLLLLYIDHFSVIFTLSFLTPRSQNNATVSIRKYHKINKEKMKADFLAAELINNPFKEPDTLYKQLSHYLVHPYRQNMHHYTPNTPKQSTSMDELTKP